MLFRDIFHFRVNENLGLQSHAEPTLRNFGAVYFFSVTGYHTSAKENSVPYNPALSSFVTPLDLVNERTRQWPIATEKHEHNTSGHFGQKKLELSPES